MPFLPELPRLLDDLQELVGARIAIEESISRDRARGHDRHVATCSRFEFVVTRVAGTISGAQILLLGDHAQYALAADAIAAVVFSPDLVVIEHFEERTERQTTMRRLPHA